MSRASRRRLSSALKADEAYALKYRPGGPTIVDFHGSSGFVRGIMGPLGSAKSTACCMEIFTGAKHQVKQRDGIRRSRYAILRNTYPELRSTTMQTWLEWFPEDRFGEVSWTPPFEQLLRIEDVESQILFFAMDREQDVKKLLSLDLTGAWVNEAREMPKAIVDALTGRVGRYPAVKDGGPVGDGVIFDTNAPAEDHWIAIMSGWCEPPAWMSEEERRALVKPKNWEFFRQPPAVLPVRDGLGKIVDWRVNPQAENLQNLRVGYYERMVAGKDQRWVSVYLANEPGTLRAGRAVYANYQEDVHVSPVPLAFSPELPVVIGLDFGLTGAMVVGQPRAEGAGLDILREFHAQGRGAKRWSLDAKAWLMLQCPWLRGLEKWAHLVHVFADPAGEQRAGTDEQTPVKIWRANGWPVKLARTNDPRMRIEVVDALFGKLVAGAPALRIDKKCEKLIAGLRGKYQYARNDQGQGEEYDELPKKDQWSHVQDGAQYLVMEYGGMDELMNRERQRKERRDGTARPGLQRPSPFERQLAARQALQRRAGRV